MLCRRPGSGCGRPGYECRQMKTKMEVVYRDSTSRDTVYRDSGSPASVRNITLNIGCSCAAKYVEVDSMY